LQLVKVKVHNWDLLEVLVVVVELDSRVLWLQCKWTRPRLKGIGKVLEQINTVQRVHLLLQIPRGISFQGKSFCVFDAISLVTLLIRVQWTILRISIATSVLERGIMGKIAQTMIRQVHEVASGVGLQSITFKFANTFQLSFLIMIRRAWFVGGKVMPHVPHILSPLCLQVHFAVTVEKEIILMLNAIFRIAHVYYTLPSMLGRPVLSSHWTDVRSVDSMLTTNHSATTTEGTFWISLSVVCQAMIVQETQDLETILEMRTVEELPDQAAAMLERGITTDDGGEL
jgi:hypothetical protein